MMLFLFAALGCLVALCETHVSAVTVNPESELRRHIFANYDKFVRPVSSPNNSVTVKAAMAPLYIKELDTKNQVLVLDTWMTMQWNDEFLKWDPSEFNNITELSIPNSLVWKPDLYSASTSDAVFPTSNNNAVVYHSGTVLWVSFYTIKSRCSLKKEQVKNHFLCIIKIGSWSYNGNLLNTQLLSDEVDLSNYQNNPDWTLEGVIPDRKSRFYPWSPEDYPVVHYDVHLKRRSTSMSMIHEV